MEFKRKQSLPASFRNAFRGVWLVLQERSFLIQLAAGAIAVTLAFILTLSDTSRIIIILLTFLVLGAEMFNSAVEYLLDFVKKDHDPDIARVKDILAGAVMVFSLSALIIGIWIFGRALGFF
ncbi:MAG: hypothetical protein A3A28_00065 [Candidatus Sungbacteria bacterium RIFCSPLOWO2_01_FULL_47_32]|uniref:Diacylglycerol kinase n=1 Tax=Candidatus Sungbacteria bacterium RIFCSPHIGHO2_01_FULL_47_32 TaxID=1802264 RepID=A0A1G2K839_9BACT|nr:MAG: Diacylglycerol kinase [Parcubacteria group bacterium GW2011_GWA2_47_10]OGZ94731.1 MAG: hypothetical protein A2633_03670 [Candidatus Sungbacteria bacterium RIFCSPHIGHO2_01_FULL_47_32]OHA05189.1 MAG: hypothetical protein A3A28_00065 [Candidatus Sungbacteria bacterium RIFCSPLOWO2_01_FULL_47_32]